MHELAVTEEILRVALEHAERAKATRISDIHLVIGALSTIVDDSVQFYFDFLSPDTIAVGAKLHFTRIPARLRCRNCQHEFEPQERDYTCSECGTLGGEVIAGKEFYLDSMQVE
jgi:hydrogenase nickel incorporation protein HypA/HybF